MRSKRKHIEASKHRSVYAQTRLCSCCYAPNEQHPHCVRQYGRDLPYALTRRAVVSLCRREFVPPLVHSRIVKTTTRALVSQRQFRAKWSFYSVLPASPACIPSSSVVIGAIRPPVSEETGGIRITSRYSREFVRLTAEDYCVCACVLYMRQHTRKKLLQHTKPPYIISRKQTKTHTHREILNWSRSFRCAIEATIHIQSPQIRTHRPNTRIDRTKCKCKIYALIASAT